MLKHVKVKGIQQLKASGLPYTLLILQVDKLKLTSWYQNSVLGKLQLRLMVHPVQPLEIMYLTTISVKAGFRRSLWVVLRTWWW